MALIRGSSTMCHISGAILPINLKAGEVAFPKLRLIYLAAEPASLTEFNLYQRHFSPSCILINGLGSTETLEYRWYL
jgi:acyl-coenzyme A synthetase/AMP-(fatty) acid ligase